MIYDTIIIWAWAAWLFTGIHLDKQSKKLILEKTEKPWMKVLLSWGERANVSNIWIEPLVDYFTQNKKFLHSIFSKYNQWDIQGFFAENWINIIEEDRWRLILESGNSKELLHLLLKKVKENNCELKINSEVKKIKKQWELYEIELDNKLKYKSKNIVVSSGWRSFFQIWTTGEWYNFAQNLWINIIPTYRSLCWLATKKDLSTISWISHNLHVELKDKNNKKEIYSESWPLLFTHFWISWPVVFNISTVIWEYLNSLWINEDKFESYILNNLSVDIYFNLEESSKKMIKFFELSEDKKEINLELQNWRSWREAKATGWWIDTNELDNYMQSKKYSGLYFIWEVVDITWKTGWFNLQWAWSSAFVCSEYINSLQK